MNWKKPASTFICAQWWDFTETRDRLFRRSRIFSDRDLTASSCCGSCFRWDPTYQNSPSMALFMMEELYEKGCTSPLLYLEAWNWISRDISNLHRLSPFWMQVSPLCGQEGISDRRTGDAAGVSVRLRKEILWLSV